MDMQGYKYALTMTTDDPHNEYYQIGYEIISKTKEGKVLYEGVVIENDLQGKIVIGTNKINDLA